MSYGNDCFVVHYSTSTWSQAMQLSWKGSHRRRRRRRTWNRNRVSAQHQFCQSTIKKIIFETFRSRMIAVTSNWRKERFTSAKTSIQKLLWDFLPTAAHVDLVEDELLPTARWSLPSGGNRHPPAQDMEDPILCRNFWWELFSSLKVSLNQVWL